MSARYLNQEQFSTPKSSNQSKNSSDSKKASPYNESSIHSSRYSQLSNSQFNIELHDSRYCVCQACDCGKHKCKLQCAKPDLKHSSTYRNSYRKSSTNFNQEPSTQFTPKKIVEKIIDNTTTYQEKFPKKEINVQKPIKRPDNQKFTGPSSELTTYQQKYPGYAGKNPYVKKKPDEFRGGLMFKGESMYDSQFLGSKIPASKPLKRPDNLRTSSCWFGKSSYKEAFKVQNPEDMKPLDYRPKSQYDKRPSSAYQYESSYKRGFENPQVKEPCPAKNLLMMLTQQIDKSQKLSDTKVVF